MKECTLSTHNVSIALKNVAIILPQIIKFNINLFFANKNINKINIKD